MANVFENQPTDRDPFQSFVDSLDIPVAEGVQESELNRELSSVLNRHSSENGSNTPDYILADYMLGCLDAFNRAVNHRESWYGRN